MFRTFPVVIFITVATGRSPDVRIVRRDEWSARPATAIQMLSAPVPYVVVHQTGPVIPACATEKECASTVKRMQDSDMDEFKKDDLAYNFVATGDGRVYEGRGWSYAGQHIKDLNAKSIGIAVLGDWMEERPPEEQLEAVRQLLEYGVVKGYLDRNYVLMPHKWKLDRRNMQVDTRVEDFQCPGRALHVVLASWKHVDEDFLKMMRKELF